MFVHAFSGAFAKLRISFFMSVCLSVGNSLAPTGQIFMKFDTLSIFFFKYVHKMLVSLILDKNNGYFT